MSERFELNRGRLFDLLGDRGIEDTRDLTLAEAVSVWSDDPRYRSESTAVLLAQLTYLLGISTDVAPRPEDFPPHCLLGVAGSYHGTAEMFMLCLCQPDAPFVCEEHAAAVEVIEQGTAESGRHMIESVCTALLDHANALIPAARAADDAR